MVYYSEHRAKFSRRSRHRILSDLKTERAELAKEWRQILEELRSTEYSGLLDEDGSTEHVSDAMLAFAMDHLGREIRAIDAALDRLQNGEYGICCACARPISTARLRANPTAERCIRCQSESERPRTVA